MKIPKNIRVGGQVYKVSKVEACGYDQTCLGEIDFRKSKIHILKKQDKQNQELTFLHELLHALFEHINFEQDESVVERLAHALYMVIQDNPGLF